MTTGTDQAKYWVAFNRISTIGRARFSILESYFGDLETAWSAGASDLEAAGLDQRSVRAIVSRRPSISPDGEWERLETLGIDAITVRDPGYPSLLKEVYDYPPVLYVKGRILPEDGRSVTIVGTRKTTSYGREVTRQLVEDLSKNSVTIVSGLARGIDSIAHRTALDSGGRTLAVLANGLDAVYPPEHAAMAREVTENGALISEHPPGVRPEAKNFPRRNRILSGLTPGTVVVEAGEGSGALWTVRHALDQDREVMAVPGTIFSPPARSPTPDPARGQDGAQLHRRAGGAELLSPGPAD